MVLCLHRKEMELGTLLKAKLQRKIHAVGEGIEEWRVGIKCAKDQKWLGWESEVGRPFSTQNDSGAQTANEHPLKLH